VSKYHNRKTILDGIRFDSQKEASRWAELRILEKAGVIKDLRRQVKYILIPAQYIQPEKGRRKLIEKECSYLADFVYTENGKTVVEDTKGVKTAAYIVKRKLMLERYGIRILEI
jgi:hypothetical protein